MVDLVNVVVDVSEAYPWALGWYNIGFHADTVSICHLDVEGVELPIVHGIVVLASVIASGDVVGAICPDMSSLHIAILTGSEDLVLWNMLSPPVIERRLWHL